MIGILITIIGCAGLIWGLDKKVEAIEKKLDRILEKLGCDDKEES